MNAMNAKYYAQAGAGLNSGLCMTLVFTLRHHLTPVAALFLCGALALVHAIISGYVWEFARKSQPERPRMPAPIIAVLGGLVMFAGTMILWMRK